MAGEAAEIGTVPGNGQPFGNIYNTATPNTEAAGQELAGLQGRILAQQQRYQAVQKNAKLKEAADQQNKIDAQVRGADVPAVHSAYNDWRAASMDLQQNSKNLPRDEYLDRQQQVNQKYANVTQLINDSTQRKAVEADMLKQQANPDNAYKFNNDAPNYLSQSIKTPINQLSNYNPTDANGKPVIDPTTGKNKTVDLTDPSVYNYKPIMDFTKPLDDAAGKTDQDLAGGIDVSKKGDINGTLKSYKGINNAYAMSNTFVNGLKSDDEKNKIKAVDKQADYIQQHGNVSDADIAATNKQFQDQYVNNPSVKEAYGLTGNEQFATTGIPQVDKYAQYDIQKKALANLPNQILKPYTNEAVKDATDHNFDLYKAKYDQNLKKGDDLSAGKSIDDNYNTMVQGNGTTVTTQVANPDKSGTFITEHRKEISAPTALLNAFEVNATDKDGKVTKVKPDKIYVRPNGNLVGAYFNRDATGNIDKSDNGNMSQRLDVTPVELDANTAKQVVAKSIGGDKAVESLSKYQQQSPTYTVGGKKYSNADLKKMGYNDNQINKAIKLGTIKQ